jgi:hypothetical protein
MRLDRGKLETRYRHVLESLGKQKGMLSWLRVNLENSPEESRIHVGEVNER